MVQRWDETFHSLYAVNYPKISPSHRCLPSHRLRALYKKATNGYGSDSPIRQTPAGPTEAACPFRFNSILKTRFINKSERGGMF